MDANQNLKLYFPNLNGLRSIGALFAIISHTEQFKPFYKIGDGEVSEFVLIAGRLAVTLFFVISGFLIGTLLLTEEIKFGKINIRKFYIRRSLRIIPLYVLLIILAFFILPNFSFFTVPNLRDPISGSFVSTLLLYIFLLPNLAMAIYGFIPYIAQAWSIGSEVQSYAILPVLFRRIKKNRLTAIILIVLVHFMLRVLLSNKLDLQIPYREIIYKFIGRFNIASIATGSFFAILYINKKPILKYILNTNLFYLISFITLLCILFAIRIPYVHHQFYAILFGFIVLNLAVNEKFKNVLEWNVLDYLGKISYGLYMYHLIVITPVLMLASKMNTNSNILIYSLILISTIIISSISYRYFEVFFLKRKTKHTLITSGKV